MNSSAGKVMMVQDTREDEGVCVWLLKVEKFRCSFNFDFHASHSGNVPTCDGEWKKYGRVKTDTDRTFGGYSGQHTVPEK